MNSSPVGFQTPILLLIFNRPETTKRVFEAIRLVKPKYLYVAADGPREHKLEEHLICSRVREIATNVDWDCEVITLFREKNLGCGVAVSEALKWFFNKVDFGIVLEDDCLPTSSFFAYCEKMLKLYEYDEQVKIVSGTNYLFNNKELIKDDYFFSNYFSIWGWASWKRVITSINWDKNQLKNSLILKKIENHFSENLVIANWMYGLIKETFDNKVDTWDSIFVCNLIFQNGKSIVPYKNQISNIGIIGTHTSADVSDNINTKTYPINASLLNRKEVVICEATNSILLNNICNYLPKNNTTNFKTKKAIRFFILGDLKNRVTHKIKRVIKTIINRTGYNFSLTKNKTKVLSNVFNSTYKQKALVSYVKSVYESDISKSSKYHTNHYTSYLFGEILNELKYTVDVVNHDICIDTDFSKYDLVIGLGASLELVIKNRNELNKQPKVIWFGTGCNPFYSNPITIKRVNDFYEKHGVLIFDSSRFIKNDEPLQHEFADWIILHGNSFSKSTYRKNNISTVNAPVFIHHSNNKTETDWKSSKQNYLWFGGGGAIHKGLDLVIDAFMEMENCILHICGNLKNEKSFLEFYTPIFNTRSNIINHGFIDVESEKFNDILKKCAFVVFPSASEANCPSVITCMANGGLIPIITKNTDIDLNDYGIIIEELTVASVINAVNIAQEFSIDKIKEQSGKILKYSNEVNTFDFFKQDFKKQLTEAIKR